MKILRERGSRPSPVRVAIALAWLIPAGLQAQGSKTIVGIVGGYGTTEQIWRPTTVAEDVGGLIVGAWVRYTSSEFAVTDRRVIIKVGLITRKKTMEMSLTKVESVQVDQTITGRML
ncbi:MAG: PH domain-containing protein, partial [Gemmatimonadetes bacterium]|nr:PH domain-containing protein [Gemmatimonadota bacterium]